MPSFTVCDGYDPHPKQAAFHRSPKRFKVASAGNRGGKTVAGAAEFVSNIFRDLAAGKGKPAVRIGGVRVPRLAYWVVTPTHELGQYPWQEIVRLIPGELFDGRPNASTRETWLKGGIQIQFKSTERAERLIAASLNGVWMDEASKCKPEAWKGGLRARLADQQGWALFTSTPYGGRNNWLYQELVAKAGVDEHVESFHWTTADNIRVPALLDEFRHAERESPPAYFKRDWLASWDSFGGTVYDEFNDDTHVMSERAFRLANGLPDRVDAEDLKRICSRIVAGVDWGHTSPGAIVVVGHVGDNRMIVLDESYAAMRPVSGHASTTWVSEAKRLKNRWGVSLFTCDHQPGNIQDFNSAGLPATSAYKDIHLGIRRVAEALHVDPLTGRPGLIILDRCKNVVREIRNYQWKSQKEQDGFAEVPADNQSDHSLDAMRYGVIELRPYNKSESGGQSRFRPQPIG